MAQQRHAVALYDYAAGAEGDLSMSEGDVVVVTDASGAWWHGYLQRDASATPGVFPSNYVKEMSAPPAEAATAAPPPSAEAAPAAPPATVARAIALHAFAAQTPGDLSFSEGDIIAVTGQDGNWWQGRLESDAGAGAKLGYFPKNYVLEFLPQPERLQASHDFQSNTTYDLDNDGEPDISFRTGDILLVEAKGEGDWWYGGVEGKEQEVGLFPAKYASPIAEPTPEQAEPMPTGPTQKVKAEMPAPGIQVDCRLSKASSGGFGLQMKQLDQLTVVGYTPMPDGSNPPAAAQVAIGCVLLGVNGKRVKRMAELKRALQEAGQPWADFSFFLATHVKEAHETLAFPLKTAVLGEGEGSPDRPAWEHPAVLDLLASPFVPKALRKSNEKEGLTQLLGSIRLVTDALQQLADESSGRSRAMQHALEAFGRSSSLLSSFPAHLFGTADNKRFHSYLQQFVAEIIHMERGSSRIFPGGWCTPSSADGRPPLHVALLFVIHLSHDDTYSLAVCNSGKGSGGANAL